MFKNKLQITFSESFEDDDTITIEGKSTECNFCRISGIKLKLTYIPDLKTNTYSCYLCDAIMNFNKSYIGKMYVVESAQSQTDINVKMMKHFIKHKQFPIATKIDPSAKLIKIQVFHFAKLIASNPKNPFKSCVIMFTDEMIKCINASKTIFEKSDIVEIKRHNSEFFTIPVHKLTQIESDFLTKTNNQIIKKDMTDVNKIQKSLDKKIKCAYDSKIFF